MGDLSKRIEEARAAIKPTDSIELIRAFELLAAVREHNPEIGEQDMEWTVRHTLKELGRVWESGPTDEETARTILARSMAHTPSVLLKRRKAGAWLLDDTGIGWNSAPPPTLEVRGRDIEYGVTYTDPDRPVTFHDNMEEAFESQRFYNRIGEGKHRSLILQRTKGVAPGPWMPTEREVDA